MPRPASRALAIAAARSATPSLVSTIDRLLRTVFSLSARRAAMRRLSSPSATRSSTSRSRSVSDGNGSGPRRREPGEHRHRVGGNRRRQQHLAGRDRPQGALDLDRPGALEQVAAGAGAHGGEDGVVVVDHRDDEHPTFGRRATISRVASTPGFVAEVEVHHHDVDLVALGGVDRGRDRVGLRDDLEPVDRGEQTRSGPCGTRDGRRPP